MSVTISKPCKFKIEGMTKTGKEFDVLLYGATGFVGKLTAARLDQAVDLTEPGRSWAIAGRSEDKLRAVQNACKTNPPAIIQCNLSDKEAVARMVSQTRVVLNCAGPYATNNSEALVACCAAQGKHYSDLAGESFWQREMVIAHHDTARKSGAKVVLGGGVDSLPSDLGVHLALKTLQPRPNEQVQVTGVYSEYSGAFSGGTLASNEVVKAALRSGRVSKQVFFDPYILAPGVQGPDSVVGTLDGFPRGFSWAFDRTFGVLISFFMAPVNAPVVRRSLSLLGLSSSCGYRECMSVGMLLRTLLCWGARGFGFFVGAPLSISPKPGQGPPQWLLENGAYTLHVTAKTAGGKPRTGKAVVWGKGDPGYGATSLMLAQTGLCLALDSHGATSRAGGVLTPATALGDVLVERLAGVDGGRLMGFRTQ